MRTKIGMLSIILAGFSCGALSQAKAILPAGFEQTDYGDWIVSGAAFGTGPVEGACPGQLVVTGGEGQRLVNTFLGGDGSTGTLTSPEFAVSHNYIRFLVGGGNHPDQTCINLIVGSTSVRTATGASSEALAWASRDVSDTLGQTAKMQIADLDTGRRRHVSVDHISLNDKQVVINSDSPGPIERAMQSVARATALAQKDPNRPVYHFRPPAQWMNDINGSIYYGGYYHIMYQHNPHSDTWGYMHFGHARSTDLVHWEHQPIALWPSYELGEEHCYSGGAAIRPKDGLPMLFYTSIGHEYREEWAAISHDNMVTWEKLDTNPVVAHTTVSGDRFSAQDPFLFVYGDKTWLISTSFHGKNPVGGLGLHLYEATDGTLTNWQYRGRFSEHASPCPNLVEIGNKWVLLLHTKWYVGTVDWKNYQFITEQQGPLVYSANKNARGSNLIVNGPRQRPLFMAWVSRRVHYDETGRGWAGCSTLPTELFIRADGGLGYKPVTELAGVRGTQTARPAFTVNDETVDIPEMQGHTRELIFEFKPSATGNSGIRLRRSADGESAVTIRYNDGNLYIEGHGENSTRVPVSLRADGSIKLHVYLDRAILEYFVNDGDRYGVQYVHNGINDTGTGVFSDGTMQIENSRAWEMTPTW